MGALLNLLGWFCTFVLTRSGHLDNSPPQFFHFTVTHLRIAPISCPYTEMLRRRQLFPGSSYIQQMKMIVSLLGSPSKELLKRCNSDQIQHFLRGLGQHTPVSLWKVFPDASGEALDLLEKILVLDPGVSEAVIKGSFEIS